MRHRRRRIHLFKAFIMREYAVCCMLCIHRRYSIECETQRQVQCTLNPLSRFSLCTGHIRITDDAVSTRRNVIIKFFFVSQFEDEKKNKNETDVVCNFFTLAKLISLREYRFSLRVSHETINIYTE